MSAYESAMAEYDGMEKPRRLQGLGLYHGMMEPCRECLHPRLMHIQGACAQKLDEKTGEYSENPCGCIAHVQVDEKAVSE